MNRTKRSKWDKHPKRAKSFKSSDHEYAMKGDLFIMSALVVGAIIGAVIFGG